MKHEETTFRMTQPVAPGHVLPAIALMAIACVFAKPESLIPAGSCRVGNSLPT